MRFLTYGNKENPSILFLHGMAATADTCYASLLPYLTAYYVILGEVEGHYDGSTGLNSLAEECTEVEVYIRDALNGYLFCLSGFSMGGTMAVEIAGRGSVTIDNLHLDAAFLVKMGRLSGLYTQIFSRSIARLLSGRKIPKALMDAVMGKDNNSVVEMLYTGIISDTIRKACGYVYAFSIPENISRFPGKAVFWYGANERYPAKSAVLLKQRLPGLAEEVFPGMGHGQYLHEHSAAYAKRFLQFLQDR